MFIQQLCPSMAVRKERGVWHAEAAPHRTRPCRKHPSPQWRCCYRPSSYANTHAQTNARGNMRSPCALSHPFIRNYAAARTCLPQRAYANTRAKSNAPGKPAQPLHTVTPDTPLSSAMALLLDAGISCLPVVDAQRRLLDVYSRADITHLTRANSYAHLQVCAHACYRVCVYVITSM